MTTLSDYIRVAYGEPHAGRGRELLAAHPELRALAGQEPLSAVWTLLLVLTQFAVAFAVMHRPWYVWLPAAFIVGATIDHALWAMIHECSHNLVFKSRNGNRLLAIVANLPLVVPGAISFIKYHLLHHRHLGEMELDTGVPGPLEARLVGRSMVTKTFWIAGYILVQAIRPHRLAVRLLDPWTVLNIAVQVGAMVALGQLAGAAPFTYLVASTVLAIGLHPLGGRWIQEHFALVPDQETYSYYGPLNRLSFNIGYHVEHHDLITVPWSRLPEVRRRAPEFYDSLQSYRSWSALVVRFIVDREFTLLRYIVRPGRNTGTTLSD
jgi:sphingolipid delta-4 desaturase